MCSTPELSAIDQVRAEANRKYGPEGWRSVTSTTLLRDGACETVTVFNTAGVSEASAPTPAPALLVIPAVQHST